MYQIFNGDCLTKLRNIPDGSTGVACMNLGLDFYGIELDPGYFQTSRERIEEAEF